MSGLPESWTKISFAEACSKISDGTHHSPKIQHAEPGPNRFKYITSKNIRPGGMDLDDLTYVDEGVHREIFARCNPEQGDVHLPKDGVNTGVVAINTLNEEFSLLSSVALLKVRKELIEPKFLKHYITSPDGSRALLGSMSGTAIRRIILRQINEATLVLPPLAEQKRIVAKIEELFSELDAGEESLRRARRQLGVYRQSLLKQAFEGKLTAPWRAQHPDLLESPDQLLARIQAERQARYQQQLKEWEKAVKGWEKNGEGKRPLKPRKTPEPQPLNPDDLSALPSLPDGWKWVHPDALMSFTPYSIGIGPFGSNLKVSDYTDSGVPLVFVKNITRNDFGLEPRFVSEEKAVELAAHTTEGGDLLITKMGDPPGDCAIYPLEAPKAVITADCLKFRVLDDYCERGFYASFINSISCRKQLGLITRGVAQKKISVDRFKSIGIPLCSLPEQQEIVRLLEGQFEVIEQNEREIDAALKRSEALRQSILKKAFTGQLVPQDPTDEPAAVLLERIRKERSSVAGIPSKKKAGRLR